MKGDFSSLREVVFRDGAHAPALGLGTWHMGESQRNRAREAAALRLGVDLGMTLIDTAEMYGEGGAEEVVGDAIAGCRDRVFIVSKVYPHNAGVKSAIAACERSLKRLRIEYLDCYLLHWRGRIPLKDTVQAFSHLARDGLIRQWGVSNFDVDDMEELLRVPNGDACAVNQVLYNLSERAVEWALLPWCRARGIVVMAYSPVGQGDLLRHRALTRIARALGCSPAQVALAWLMRHPDVIAIPQSSDPEHVRDNRACADLALTDATLAALDAAFPPPRQPTTISVI